MRTCSAFVLSQCVQTITASHSRTSRENPILGDVPLKKKRKKNTLRSPADIARFRLNKSPLSPIPNVRFFSLDRLYCVTCSIRDSESLCSLKWLAWVDCEFTRHFYYTFNNYLHRSPLFYTNCRLAWIFSRRGKIPIVCYNSIIESWAITVK